MNFVLPFSLVGISASLVLGSLFLTKGKGKFVYNIFLGLFFLLLAVRLGKLIAQTFAPAGFLDLYFNVMHGAYLAMGPVIWLYISRYLSQGKERRSALFHFVPAFFVLVLAFYLRQVLGESVWLWIYWIIQVHPLLYVVQSLSLIGKPTSAHLLTRNQKVWLYSLVGAVVVVATMNVFYFLSDFPFYLVTALLLMVTFYLFAFLAFNNKAQILIGKSDQKYKNIKLSATRINQMMEEVERLMKAHAIFLEPHVKVQEVASLLKEPSHLISRVVNETKGITFPEYVNSMRVAHAQKLLVDNPDAKIIAIALESGFHSLSAFNRAFRKQAAMSPSEFRANNLRKESAI